MGAGGIWEIQLRLPVVATGHTEPPAADNRPACPGIMEVPQGQQGPRHRNSISVPKRTGGKQGMAQVLGKPGNQTRSQL